MVIAQTMVIKCIVTQLKQQQQQKESQKDTEWDLKTAGIQHDNGVKQRRMDATGTNTHTHAHAHIQT